MTPTRPIPHVAVVGAGISGAACAVALTDAGIGVDVIERGRAPGGRLAAPELHGRRVDLGAAYFTVRDTGFTSVVDRWSSRGLARVWTDTLDVLTADGSSTTSSTTSGAPRWAARDGLRSLVRDLLPVEVELGRGIDSLDALDHDAVVLAMPDPQATRLIGDAIDVVDYEPVIAVAAGFDRRDWTLASAAFVNDDLDLSLVADDGSRRGDGAPVLVLHTTGELARRHLDDPDAAVAPAVAAATRLLGITGTPTWTHTHRWTFAKPAGTHGDEPFGMVRIGGRDVGVCGDSWCPEGSPRAEAAWLSGTRLGHELAARLTS